MKNVYIDFVSNYIYSGFEEKEIVYTKDSKLNRLVVPRCKEVILKEGYITIDYKNNYKIKIELSNIKTLVIN